MKAIVKTKVGVGNVEFMNIDEPVLKKNEVKIKVEAVGICGTDIKIKHGDAWSNPPVVLGHELSGVIAEVGPDVKSVKVGDRVVTETGNVYGATAPDGSYVSVVPYLPSGDGISVKGYFEKSEELMQSTSGGQYRRISEAEIAIGGGKALQYEYEYTVGGVTYRYLQVIIGYKSMIYSLTYTALPQNYDTNRADVDAIIAAFTFR